MLCTPARLNIEPALPGIATKEALAEQLKSKQAADRQRLAEVRISQLCLGQQEQQSAK